MNSDEPQMAFQLGDDRPPRPPRLPLTMDGKICRVCGGLMQRTGACHTCSSCGESDGCG